MVSDTPNSIHLEVSKHTVAADLRGLARQLAQAAAQGVILQDWPGVVASLLAAATTVRVEPTPGTLAWELLLIGIGEAVSELANDQPPHELHQDDVAHINSKLDREAQDLLVPADFLDHPWSLPPVKLAKHTLLSWLAPHGRESAHDLVNLGHRFDSALVLGLHRTIRENEVRYRPLFQSRTDPMGQAWQVLEDWRLYRAHLRAEFRAAPVFDETFALDQIYVSLNAWRLTEQDSNQAEEQKRVREVVRLTDDVVAWLRGERGNGRLRLVSGGPGSGKSSAMKALAAQLAEGNEHEDVADVLLFPLQRFHWRVDVIESVKVTLNDYDDKMRHNPLEADHLRNRCTPLLLIFDGLDELSASTEVSEAISATFLRQLSTSLRNWSERMVWVIVTGRDAIFGNVEGPTTGLPGERFQLLPYHIREREPGLANRSAYHDPTELLAGDKRIEAFNRFVRAKRGRSEALPKAYARDELHDVSSQPLLNYFLLTSGPDKIVDSNIARIYKHLFERLHARNRNISNRPRDAGKPGAGLTKEMFDRVFEAMAVGAWRTGGTRAATWADVLVEVEREDSYLRDGDERLSTTFQSQMHDRSAQRPFRLAAAFFMRNEQTTGVEFTHKSFGDYLYARRLARALKDMATQLTVAPAVETEMLRRWADLTAEQRMSYEVKRFLELELEASVETNTARQWHGVLTPVVKRVFSNGFEVTGSTQRRAEQRSCQMEEALFIAWHALWRRTEDEPYWSFGSETGELMRRAQARQASVQDRLYGQMFQRSWAGVDFGSLSSFAASFFWADLTGANFRNAMLRHANLQFVTLVGADLRRARFDNARLDYCLLHGANCKRTMLKDACLRNANLMDSDLRRASFRRAVLIGARLDGADMRRADLRRADLRLASLVWADLRGSDFRRADLRGASLENADLRGADLRRANLRHANLEGANLEGAKLHKAKLPDIGEKCVE